MGIAYNPRFVPDGLLFYYDLANVKTYSGTGSKLLDISGNRIDSDLINTPSFSTDNLGYMNTNGTNEYIQTPAISAPTRERTVNMIYRFNSGQGSLWRVQDWRERIFSTIIVIIPDSGTYYYVNAPVNDGNIHNICYSYSGTSLKTYRDGNLIESITMNSEMSAGSFNFRFGNLSSGSSNYYSNLDYYHISFYNRQLSDAEVKQNFDALRERYGL
jgi:hypothetical protein